MEPRFHTGDLAVLRPVDHYRVGDVAAYRSRLLHTVVMHRIVAITNGRYAFKGDNNSWRDPERPESRQLVGALVLRIPHGGEWLRHLTTPAAIGLSGFVLALGGGAATTTKRRRKTRRKRGAMSRHAVPPRKVLRRSPVAAAAAASAGLAVLALSVAAVAWTAPSHREEISATRATQKMTFGYTAKIRPSAAYSATTVTTPQPVFRKLTKSVHVAYRYSGSPGTISVAALLAAPSGWHTTIPLTPPVSFGSGSYAGSVTLDLDQIYARGQAAATAIGIPTEELTVTVTPTVRSSSGAFTPNVAFTLTPLQLTLADPHASLTDSASTDFHRRVSVAATLPAFQWAIRVTTARNAAVAMAILAILAGVGVAIAHRSIDTSHAASIRRRYPHLLVPVEPTPALTAGTVVDVTTFETLARVAERYGLLVLHWTRSGIQTYVVQDDLTTYRYREGAATSDRSRTDDAAAAAHAARDPQHPLRSCLSPAVRVSDARSCPRPRSLSRCTPHAGPLNG